MPVREVVQIPKNGKSIGLLCVVRKEFESVEAKLTEYGWTLVPDRTLGWVGIDKYVKSSGDKEHYLYASLIDRMGQANSAIETMAFVERTKCDIIFMVGIAGKLQGESSLKDVVVAKDLAWHVLNKTQEGSKDFPPFRNGDFAVPDCGIDFNRSLGQYISKAFSPTSRHLNYRVWHEDVFSWDYVTSGAKATGYVLGRMPKAFCVEMEGAGFLSAVHRFGKIFDQKYRPAFVVRGLSDSTIDKDKTQSDDSRRLASANAIEVANFMIEDLVINRNHDIWSFVSLQSEMLRLEREKMLMSPENDT